MRFVHYLITSLFSLVVFAVFAIYVAFVTNILYFPRARAIDDSVPAEKTEFDFIIVGAGSAGATVASRLSENPNFKVLLLEAGYQDNHLFIKAPAMFYTLFKTKFDWAFYTTPQTKHGDGRSHFWPRGKVLGGSSSLNANINMWGPKEDYDAWDEMLGGDSGWSGDEVWSYFTKTKIPMYQAKADVHPISKNLVESVHNYFKIPVAKEFNSKKHEASVGYNHRTVHNGIRASSAEMYLTPDVVKRPNLFIKTQAHVTKIVFDKNHTGDQKRVSGVVVDFVRGKKVHTVELLARKEVILSAGSVQTPQILMVSGVGDPKVLEKHNIPVVVPNDQVGQNLQDHYTVGVMMEIKDKISLHIMEDSVLELLKHLGQWLRYRTGTLASNSAEVNGLFYSPTAKKNGEKLPDFQFVGLPGLYDEHGLIKHPGLHGFSLGAVLLRPKSRGYITINSNSTHDNPVIDPNYFSDPERDDISRMLQVFKQLREMFKVTEPINKLVTREVVPGEQYKTDEEMEHGIKMKGITLYHPVGTASMGKVTDKNLKVIGVENLRVVDASVMPKLIGANTNLPTIMIAEKASDIIRSEYA